MLGAPRAAPRRIIATARLLTIAALVLAVGPLGAQKRQSPAKRPGAVPPAAVKTERQVPFRVGERLSYEITWSSFVTATAATAEITVREKKPAYGSPAAYYIVAEGRPTSFLAMLYPLYYKADTWLDAYSLVPLRASVFSQERNRRENEVTLFDQAKGTARFEVEQPGGGRAARTTTLRIQPQTQDALSAVFALRAMTLTAGARLTMPLTFNGAIYDVQVTVVRRESLKTAMGTVPAWRITPVLMQRGVPTASPRGIVVWISDDARRLPLKMQVELPTGRFDLTLTGAGTR